MGGIKSYGSLKMKAKDILSVMMAPPVNDIYAKRYQEQHKLEEQISKACGIPHSVLYSKPKTANEIRLLQEQAERKLLCHLRTFLQSLWR